MVCLSWGRHFLRFAFLVAIHLPHVAGSSNGLPTLHLGVCELNEDLNNPPPFPAVVVLTKNSIESSDPIVPLPGRSQFNLEIFVDYAETYEDATSVSMTHLMGDRLEGETRPPVQGVIGCGGSSLSMQVAPFGHFLGVPLVSWWAGAPDLSNKLEFPNFLRTRGTSTGNGAGVVVLCHHFGWKQIGFIYQGQSFHIGVYDGAAAKAVELGVDIDPYVLFHFPDEVDEDVWRSKMEEAAESSNRVFGMSVVGARGVNALNVGLSLGMNTRLFIQALELADFYPNHPQSLKDAWNGMLGIDYGQSGQNEQAARFEQMWNNMTFTKMRESGIIPEEWTAIIERQTPDVFSRSPFMQFQAYLFDAIMALCIAFQAMLDNGIPGNQTSYGQEYIDALFATSFTGPSGFVSFTPVVDGRGGDRDASTFNVFNSWNSEVHLIGTLSLTATLAEDPRFPDGGQDPRSYDPVIVCASGQALRTQTDGSLVCEDCAAGTGVSPDGRDCVPCEPGYKAPAGSGVCTPCVAGTFEGERASERCQDCPAGTFAAAEGQQSCEACPSGTFAETSGMTQCMNCSLGSAQAATRQQECIRCAPGTYADEEGMSECRRCPDTMHDTPGGAVSLEECVCVAGSFTRSRGEPCEACPEGMLCAGGSNLDNFFLFIENSSAEELIFPELERGFFSTRTLPLDVFKCHEDVLCPGGVPGSCSDIPGNGEFQCPSCPDHTYIDENGKCQDCTASNYILVLVAFVVGVLVSIAIFLASGLDLTTQKAQGLLLAMTAGQVCTFVQVLAAYAAMELDWGEPLVDVLDAFGLLSFNLEVIRIGCVSAADNAGNYALQVFTPVFGVLVMVACFVLSRVLRRDYSIDGLINAIGQLAVLLYISLAMAALTPFHCYVHPNGKKSLIRFPEILCWDSPQHGTMVTLGVLAILIYPVLTMAVVFWAVYQYPLVMLRDSISFVSRYRFLFFRWRPSCYWFIGVLTLRNFFVSVFPMVIPVEDNQVSAVFIHATLLVTWGLSLSFQPWRNRSMNWLDAFLNVWLLVVLNVGMLTIQGTDLSGGVSIFLTVALFLCFTFAACTAGWYLNQYLKGGKLWAVFLSHHKGTGACTARLLKMMLVRSLRSPIFYDCDNLQSLGGIFDAVKASRLVLVILSGETLCRPWCMGEVVTAFLSGVSMQALSFHSQPSSGAEEGVASPTSAASRAADDRFLSLAEDQKHEVYQSFEVLRPFGIPLDRVGEAVKALLRRPTLKLAAGQATGLETVTKEIKRVYAEVACKQVVAATPRQIFQTQSTMVLASSEDVREHQHNNGDTQASKVLICTDHSDNEAAACAHIFRLSLQARLQENLLMDMLMDPSELLSATKSTRLEVVLWVATASTMMSAQQLGQAGLLFRVRPRAQVLLAVVGDGFAFPSTAFYDELVSGKPGLEEDTLADATGFRISALDVVAALKVIFAGIAVFVNIPAADEAILTLSMDKVTARLRQMRGLATEDQLSGGSDPQKRERSEKPVAFLTPVVPTNEEKAPPAPQNFEFTC